MDTRRTLVLLLASTLAFARPAAGQCRLDVRPSLGFAAVDRGRAIQSSRSPQGQAQVTFFEKTALGWEPGLSLTVSDFSVVYGAPVAIDGDRALAGVAESAGPRGQYLAGRAFVFDRVGSTWVPTELEPPDHRDGDFFGSAVALAGDVAVVVAEHEAKGGGDGHPRTHVFEFDGTAWSETAVIRVRPYTVAVAGDTIVIVTPWAIAGDVFVHRKVGGSWTRTQVLRMAVPGREPPFHGGPVAIQGDTLVVGAPEERYLKVFRRRGPDWVLAQRIEGGDAPAGYDFAWSVALDGPTLLVGHPTGGTLGPGTVWRFEDDGVHFVPVARFGSDLHLNLLGAQLDVSGEDAVVSTYTQSSFFRLGFEHTAFFCPATANSTGAHGSLAVEGCDSLSGARMTLVASDLPANVLARAFFGPVPERSPVPYGDGFRCVGSPLYRLPASRTDRAGSCVHEIDFDSAPASHLAAGRTWHFQVLHRDRTGAGLNATNALSIGVTP